MKRLIYLVAFFCLSTVSVFSQTHLRNVTVEWKENGVWRMKTLEPGTSTTIYPNQGNPVNLMIRRTLGADLPAEYSMSDTHNGSFLRETTYLESYTFSNCVGPMDAQVWAMVNGMEGRVEVFVKWKQPPLPDLSVFNLSVGGSVSPGMVNYHVGQTVDLSCYVLNAGGDRAGSSHLGYYIKTTADNTSGAPFDDNYVPSLGPNKRSRQTSSYTFTPGDAGTRYFVFEADFQNETDDANDNNNIRSFGPFQVLSPPSFSLLPANEGFGSIEVDNCSEEKTFQLKNTGQSEVEVYASLLHKQHFTITSGEGSFRLGPGETQSISVEFCPKSVGPKTDYLRVYADGVNSHLVQTTLTGSGATPLETIVAYSDNFIFDTRNVNSDGIFLKIIETDATKKMVHSVGYKYYPPNPNTPTSSTVMTAIVDTNQFKVNEQGHVFLSPPEFPEESGDHEDFLDEIILYNDKNEQIGHIAYSYSFKHEGMNARHALIFLHNDGEIFGGNKNDDNRFFPYHKNSPNNPEEGKRYNYYQDGEYPVSMLIPPHCADCVPCGYRFPEDYNKNPVLFVHGLTGTFSHQKEADQSSTSEKGDQVSYWFDTERKLNAMGLYHAWQFYYPNEDDLVHCGMMLGETVDYLTGRYSTPLNFVAHSMGGLVTMEYLTKEGNYDSNEIGKVILSMSPIHGSLAANRMKDEKIIGGIGSFVGFDKKAPCYRDLSMGSDFLYNLHGRIWDQELINNTIAFMGLTAEDYKLPKWFHKEAFNHEDGIASYSSVSLLEQGIGFVGYYGNHDDGKYSKSNSIENRDKAFVPKLINAYFNNSINFSDYCIENPIVDVFVGGSADIIKGNGNDFNDLRIDKNDVDFCKGSISFSSHSIDYASLDLRYQNLDNTYRLKTNSLGILGPITFYLGSFIKNPNNGNLYGDELNHYFFSKELNINDAGFVFMGDDSMPCLPVVIEGPDNIPYKVGEICREYMQHQFVFFEMPGGTLKSTGTNQTSPTKSLEVDDLSDNKIASIFIDDQTSLVDFNFYSEEAYFAEVDYNFSLLSPSGQNIDSQSSSISYYHDTHTSVKGIKIFEPEPGEWVVQLNSNDGTEDYEYITRARLNSDILPTSLIEEEYDINIPVQFSGCIKVPEMALLNSESIEATIEIENEDETKKLHLSNIEQTDTSIIVSHEFYPAATGLHHYTMIIQGVYNNYRFERALYGSFTVKEPSSVITIPNQELNINNRFVELTLPHYFNSSVTDIEEVTFEVRLDSLTFERDDIFFGFNSETNKLTLLVEEDTPMSSAWFRINCFNNENLIASTTFSLRYTSSGVPDYLNAVDITASSAALDWIPRDTETSWDIIYGPSGFDLQTEGTLVEDVTNYPYLIENLNAGEGYDFYVRAVHDATPGRWSWPSNFTTNHIISATTGNNGQIVPGGDVEVSHRSTQTFSLQPDDHYHVSGVLVNGESVGAVTSFSFEDVTESHTIIAEFSINVYSVVADVNQEEYGTVIGSGNFEYGRQVILEAIAEDGYIFQNWTEKGTVISEEAVFIFEADANRKITAHFAKATGVSTSELENVKIYPNPFNETIIIKNASQLKRITVTNPLGQIVLIKELTGAETESITMDNLSVGLYFMKLQHVDNSHIIKTMIKN